MLRSNPVLGKFLKEPLPYLWYGLAGRGCISSEGWYLASVGGQKGGLFSNGKAGKLYAMKLKNGAVLWSKSLSIQPYGGSLVVPTTDAKNVYAATAPSMRPPAPFTVFCASPSGQAARASGAAYS